MQNLQNKKCIITTKVTRVKTQEGKLMNQYLKLKRIGDGPHSKVLLYKNIQNNKFYAIKKFSLYLLKKKTRLSKDLQGKNKHISIVDDIRREVQIMKNLNHPNVITLHEVIDDLQNEKLYLVMDYCEKGQISSWNHKKHEFENKKEYLQPTKFRNLLKQIYKGLNYCKLDIQERKCIQLIQFIVISNLKIFQLLKTKQSKLLTSVEPYNQNLLNKNQREVKEHIILWHHNLCQNQIRMVMTVKKLIFGVWELASIVSLQKNYHSMRIQYFVYSKKSKM